MHRVGSQSVCHPRTFEATTLEEWSLEINRAADIAAAVHAAVAALEPLIGTVEDVALPHPEEIVPAWPEDYDDLVRERLNTSRPSGSWIALMERIR